MMRTALTLVLAATLAAVPGVAHAKPRKLNTAYALSGVGTGASLALIAGAFLLPSHSGDINLPMLYSGLATSVVTPSLGNWYAGNWLTVGMGIRVVAGGLATYVAITQRDEVQCGGAMPDFCRRLSNTGVTLLGIAGIVYVGGAAYDFKTLQGDVDTYNAKHPFQWAPTVAPSPSGTGAVLGIGGVF
ncbi:hypothetical protein BH11MYX3_BH11MYX3_08370 [soil metagenome]